MTKPKPTTVKLSTTQVVTLLVVMLLLAPVFWGLLLGTVSYLWLDGDMGPYLEFGAKWAAPLGMVGAAGVGGHAVRHFGSRAMPSAGVEVGDLPVGEP